MQIGNFLDWKGLPNVHILFCLHKTSSFYWFVIKIKKFMLPIGDTIEVYFLLGIKYFGGLRSEWVNTVQQYSIQNQKSAMTIHFVQRYGASGKSLITAINALLALNWRYREENIGWPIHKSLGLIHFQTRSLLETKWGQQYLITAERWHCIRHGCAY